MTIIEAMTAVRVHPWPKARRKLWRKGWIVSGNESTVWVDGPGDPVRNIQYQYQPSIADVLADDWVLLIVKGGKRL